MIAALCSVISQAKMPEREDQSAATASLPLNLLQGKKTKAPLSLSLSVLLVLFF